MTTATGKPLTGWVFVTVRRRGEIIDQYRLCPTCATDTDRMALCSKTYRRDELVHVQRGITVQAFETCTECEGGVPADLLERVYGS